MILSFKHKGLQRLYFEDSESGVAPEHADKLRRILTMLNIAQNPLDLAIPAYRLHQLSGKQKSTWSISVTGNWRVTFKFQDSDVVHVDYLDYH